MQQKRDGPRCKACGARIVFIRSKNGSHIPVDPRPLQFEPDEAGPERLVRENGEVVRCRLVEPDRWDPFKVGYRSHFSTCPEGERMRSKKAAEAAEARRREAEARRAEEEAAGVQLTF